MTELEKRFIAARRSAIAVDYQNLNPRQREGVLATEGPLLLLAGAGSGKTSRVCGRSDSISLTVLLSFLPSFLSPLTRDYVIGNTVLHKVHRYHSELL